MTAQQPRELTAGTRGNPRTRKRLPHPIGRTTLLTEESQKKVCDAVRAGAYLTVAARYAGVAPGTLVHWMSRGRECPGPKHRDWIYRLFVEAVEEAEAQSEVAANLQWRAAWAKDWHAAEKWLSVRYPERYRQDRDPATQAAAMAGINLTINTPNSTTTTPAHTQAVNAPLEQLIEANPRLLSATMHLFEEIDAIYGDGGPSRAAPEPPYARPTRDELPEDVIEGAYTRIAENMHSVYGPEDENSA